MAKAGYASLCLLLVVATFAQCVLGQIGKTYVHNSASLDVTHGKYITHSNICYKIKIALPVSYHLNMEGSMPHRSHSQQKRTNMSGFRSRKCKF